jgi:hypothetical protein
MTKRIPMKGGDEYDGLTKARRFHAMEEWSVERRSNVHTTNGFVNILRR